MRWRHRTRNIFINYNHGLIRMTNNFLTRIRRSSLHDARGTQLPRDNAGATKRTASGLASNYRIRVEMLQLSVLISMPSANKSKRKNHILEKTDPDRDEDDEDLELPNMVFGVTRINYRQPTSTLGPTHLPHTKINDAPIWRGVVLNSASFLLLPFFYIAKIPPPHSGFLFLWQQLYHSLCLWPLYSPAAL